MVSWWNSWTARQESCRKERSVSYSVDDVINAIAGAYLLARKTPSEAGKVVAMPKRQAISPRTLNRLRPRGRVEALRAEPRDSLYASVGWVSARGRSA